MSPSTPSAPFKRNKLNRFLFTKMALPKLLLSIAILPIFATPSSSTQSERQIQIPALKRTANLGDLYDEKTDKVINVGVFRRNIPTEHISETQNPTRSTDAAIYNFLENHFKLFNIDENEAVNILTSITTPRGAARILNANKQRSEVSGTFLYKHQTVVQSLWAFHEELKDLYNDHILRHIEATHVVTSITWGATVSVTLDGSSIENHIDTQKTQNLLNKELRSLRGKLSTSDEIESNFSMSMASDIPIELEVPTTAKEVKEILSQVPALISAVNQGKGIPIQYTLTPINMIREHMGLNIQNTTAHQIDEFTLSDIISTFQDLRSAEDRIHQLKKQITGHSNCVKSQTTTKIKGIVADFETFKTNFAAGLKKSVVAVRSGVQEIQALSDLIEDFRNSEFHPENVNHGFVNFSKEISQTKVDLCTVIQNEFSQIQYFGAGDDIDLITKLTTLQKSEKSVYVMFTNSMFQQNQLGTYTELFSTFLKKHKEGTNVCLFVNCEFSNSNFCNDLNDTVVFEYANGIFIPSVDKCKILENSKILELEAAIAEMEKKLSHLRNLTIDQRHKELETESNFFYLQNRTSVLEQKLECLASPCLNGGKRFFKHNERHCECSEADNKHSCETNIDDCADQNICLNGGSCVDSAGNFSCTCALGFTGNHCETDIDDCDENNQCLNGGSCVDGAGNFSCACALGFTGFHCEINIDDCAGHSFCLNGGTCVNGAISYTCACAEAFFGDHCEHRNECVYPGTCSSLSALSKDAKCKCREGHAPDPHDSRRCEPLNSLNKTMNENATLIFGSYGDDGGIEQFSLSQRTVTRIQNHSRIDKALDVMYRTNTMFWSDESGKIYSAPIHQGAAKTVVLNDSGSRILSLSIDWVYGHLYFADDERDTISVTNLDGSMKKVLFATGVTHTWAIAVDPLSGWIYWADYVAKNIERAAMDGSQREVIAHTGSNIPVGLSLDMTQNRLYWTTLKNASSIHSMNVNGSDKTLVFKETRPDISNNRFWSITIFDNLVYWRDSTTKSVHKTNKCGGGGAIKIHSTAEQEDGWLTLQVYHFSKQPEGVNYCDNRIGGQCSHLCFRIPSTGNQSVVATKCACPDGRSLSSDQRTCT